MAERSVKLIALSDSDHSLLSVDVHRVLLWDLFLGNRRLVAGDDAAEM